MSLGTRVLLVIILVLAIVTFYSYTRWRAAIDSIDRLSSDLSASRTETLKWVAKSAETVVDRQIITVTKAGETRTEIVEKIKTVEVATETSKSVNETAAAKVVVSAPRESFVSVSVYKPLNSNPKQYQADLGIKVFPGGADLVGGVGGDGFSKPTFYYVGIRWHM